MSRRSNDWVWVAALTLWGLAIRSWRLGDESAWYDELVSVISLGAPSLGGFLHSLRAADPPMMPLYFTLEYCWAHLFGDSILCLRWLSVLIGTAAIPAIFLAGRRMHSARAGLIAAMCHAGSLSLVLNAQTIRMYGLFILLTLLSAYTLFGILDTSGKRAWAAHVVVNGLLLWTHLYSAFIVFAEVLFLAIYWRRRPKRLAVWTGLHALLFAPWAFWVATIDFAALEKAAAWIPPADANMVGQLLLYLAGARFYGFGHPMLYGACPLWMSAARSLDAVVAGLLIAPIALYLPRAIRRPRRRGIIPRPHSDAGWWFALTWLLVSPGILCVMSVVREPCLFDRYIINVAPALLLLSGMAIAELAPRAPARALATALFVGYTLLIAAWPRPWREDWHALGAYLETHARPTDAIVISGGIDGVPLLYYTPQLRSRIMLLDSWEQLIETERKAFNEARDLWNGPVDPGSPEWIGVQKFLREVRKEKFEFVKAPGFAEKAFLFHIIRHPR